MAGRVTLQTLADALGVSRTTVSNAYNRPDQLAPELRAAILEKAAELGYAGPDPAARRLRSGQRRAVALMFSARLSYAVTDPAAIALLQGLTEATERKGYELHLLPGRRGPGWRSRPSARPSSAASASTACPTTIPRSPPRSSGGCRSSWSTSRASPARSSSASRTRPARAPRRGICASSGTSTSRVIVDRLRDDGTGDRIIDAERIADGYYRVSRERIAGWFDGLGGPVPVYEANENEPAAGARGAAELLALTPRPTALLCASDQLSLGALEAVAAAGLDVPGDISVIGYDDVPAAARADLTTVRQPLLEKGRQAGRLLLEHGTEREVILPVELVVRGTTAPPALGRGRPTGRSRGPCRCSAPGRSGSRRRPGRSSRGR